LEQQDYKISVAMSEIQKEKGTWYFTVVY